MKRLILATGSDENYIKKIKNYLSSIIVNSNFDENVLVVYTDGNRPILYLKSLYLGDKLKFAKISESVVTAKNKNNCLQHGEFIKADFFNQFDDDDVIFFTDGDMAIQRELTDEEKEQFKKFTDNDVYVGYNKSPEDNLFDEAKRLVTQTDTPKEFLTDWSKIKIYNTGVLGMNKKTWLKLMNDYIKLFPFVDTLFNHYAKQQWLICFIIGTKDYNIIEMPYNIHNHTHYPSPAGSIMDNKGIVRYNNEVVLFKHRW